jgi:diguanylate cyclase (GGDEF)-like protein
VWVATRTGSRRWLALTANGEHDARGRRTGTIVIAGDDTARRAAEQRLERLAHQDPLTGLANRRRLFEALAGSLRALDSGSSVAVVFVDLDYFKEVNDALGHDAGDRLLVELARRLRRVARPGELVARVGGDEFVLVLDVAGPEDAGARVESLMRSLDDRVESGGLRLAINVSIGVATIGPEDADLSADEVIQRADAAMYVAKTSGRNRWAAYDDDMRRRDRLKSEVWQLLEDSIRDGRVAVAFQPVVDLATGRVVGAEALARIRDALPFLLTPDAFLDIAEETGLIVPLGEVVVAEACARLAEWTRIDPDFVVTVNLSGRQLAHPGAARAVLGSLESAGVDPARLCVEITESVLIEVVGDLAESVQELRRAGVQLALDDFGTGYSSLSRIRDFPIDVIKVDRSFVVGAVDDPIDAAIVAAVVQLAASLDLLVVAEGIEDRAQLDAVRRLGCAQGQGFHFGTPMDAGALAALVGTAFVADP